MKKSFQFQAQNQLVASCVGVLAINQGRKDNFHTKCLHVPNTNKAIVVCFSADESVLVQLVFVCRYCQVDCRCTRLFLLCFTQ